jgi:hypothetical protein
MRRPSRQMARTGGNCGLLLALVSPVGCESRNGGRDAEPASAATATTLLAPFTPDRPTKPPAAQPPISSRCFRRCVITRVTVMRECESRLSAACRVIPSSLESRTIRGIIVLIIAFLRYRLLLLIEQNAARDSRQISRITFGIRS